MSKTFKRRNMKRSKRIRSQRRRKSKHKVRKTKKKLKGGGSFEDLLNEKGAAINKPSPKSMVGFEGVLASAESSEDNQYYESMVENIKNNTFVGDIDIESVYSIMGYILKNHSDESEILIPTLYLALIENGFSENERFVENVISIYPQLFKNEWVFLRHRGNKNLVLKIVRSLQANGIDIVSFKNLYICISQDLRDNLEFMKILLDILSEKVVEYLLLTCGFMIGTCTAVGCGPQYFDYMNYRSAIETKIIYEYFVNKVREGKYRKCNQSPVYYRIFSKLGNIVLIRAHGSVLYLDKQPTLSKNQHLVTFAKTGDSTFTEDFRFEMHTGERELPTHTLHNDVLDDFTENEIHMFAKNKSGFVATNPERVYTRTCQRFLKDGEGYNDIKLQFSDTTGVFEVDVMSEYSDFKHIDSTGIYSHIQLSSLTEIGFTERIFEKSGKQIYHYYIGGEHIEEMELSRIMECLKLFEVTVMVLACKTAPDLSPYQLGRMRRMSVGQLTGVPTTPTTRTTPTQSAQFKE